MSAGLMFVQLQGVLLYPAIEDTQIGCVFLGVFGLVLLGKKIIDRVLTKPCARLDASSTPIWACMPK